MTNSTDLPAAAPALVMAQDGKIEVRVVDSNENGENALFFRLKPTTNLKKMMDFVAERWGKDRHLCRFHFDGERIQDEDTPDSLHLEGGDQIDMFEQVIGRVLKNTGD